jgi:glycosyltransferase involved in cell wall biosynthesis
MIRNRRLKILHAISPVSFGGGESLLINLIGENTESTNEAVLTSFKSNNFSKLLQNNAIEEYCMSNIKIGSGPNLIRFFLKTIQIIFTFPRYISALNKFNPDIVHTHSFPSSIIFPILKFLGFTKARLINTRHIQSRKHPFIQKVIFKWMFSKYDAITAVSEAARQSIICQYDIDVKVIYNCIDNRFFSHKGKIEKTSMVTAVQSGRFSPGKNQDLVIKSLANLLKNDTCNLKIVFAGDGELLNYCKDLAVNLNVMDNIEFVGRIDLLELIDVYSSSDFAIHLSESEGFSLATIEYLAFSLPVLHLDYPPMMEAVGPAGIQTSKNDIEKNTLLLLRKYEELSIIAKNRSYEYKCGNIKSQYNEMYNLIIKR